MEKPSGQSRRDFLKIFGLSTFGLGFGANAEEEEDGDIINIKERRDLLNSLGEYIETLEVKDVLKEIQITNETIDKLEKELSDLDLRMSDCNTEEYQKLDQEHREVSQKIIDLQDIINVFYTKITYRHIQNMKESVLKDGIRQMDAHIEQLNLAIKKQIPGHKKHGTISSIQDFRDNISELKSMWQEELDSRSDNNNDLQ